MMAWRLSELVRCTPGQIVGNDCAFTSVSTDSRTLQPGALFVALSGPSFDGHDFVASAAERSEVGRHMHGCGADGFGKRGNSRVRPAPSDHQPAVQSVAQFTQRVVEVLQPPRPGRRLQPGVQHVAGQYLTIRLRRIQQGRQVAQPQIPP